MRTVLLLSAKLLLFLLVSPSAAALARDNVDQVITKATAALGGEKNIHALHSLVFLGPLKEGRPTRVLSRMRPRLRVIGCRPGICDEWGCIVEGYDGEGGWELNWPKQRVIRTVNKAEMAMRCGAEFDPLFVDYKQRGFHAEYLGKQQLLGKYYETIQVDPRNGCQVQTFYLDPQTFLPAAWRLSMPIHARGKLIDTAVIVLEYRDVNGVQIPARVEERDVNTGEVLEGGGEWEKILANTVSDRALFQAPEVHPGPLTALVLRMLEAGPRVGPKAMLALYVDFRATDTGKSLDTESDLTWLGYEFLKVDRFDLAVPVFKQVTHEHPTSSNAFDSLGDAYLQMGKRVEAVAAFEKAVLLDPDNADPARKLAKLRKGQTLKK